MINENKTHLVAWLAWSESWLGMRGQCHFSRTPGAGVGVPAAGRVGGRVADGLAWWDKFYIYLLTHISCLAILMQSM